MQLALDEIIPSGNTLYLDIRNNMTDECLVQLFHACYLVALCSPIALVTLESLGPLDLLYHPSRPASAKHTKEVLKSGLKVSLKPAMVCYLHH